MPKKSKPTNFWRATGRLLSYLHNWLFGIAIVLIMAIASVVLQIVTPKVLGEATTVVYQGVMKGIREQQKGIINKLIPIDTHLVLKILLLVAVLYGLAALFNIVQQLIMNTISQRIVYQLRKDIKAKMKRLPVSYYDSHSNGDIMSRVINDIDNISTMLQTNLSQFVTSVFTFIGVLYMMFSISWKLTLVALISLPIILLILNFIAPRSQRYFSQQQRHLGNLNDDIEEHFAGHNVVKTFNREKTVINRFKQENQKYYNSAWKAQFVSSFMFPIMNLIKNLDYVAVAIMGGIQVASGTVTLGNVQAFLQYTNMFSQPITQLANLTNTIQSTIASAERVFEVLDEPEMDTKKFPAKKENTNDQISFNHVDFQYEPDVSLIKDFNLDVKKGSTVAIVGPTGAGKTTVINLLERFYDVNSGSINLNGSDIRSYSRPALRSNIAMVLQDTWLFNGSVYDNIKYGNLNASKDDVYQAAKNAHADSFINRLPNGYQTVLKENASNISQGQRQLLTIARAFIAKPKVLILDEATSSVDTQTEKLIQHAMDTLVQGRTSFVVAHRLSTIKNADKIIVMNHGSIIEIGNHDSLMKKNGFYASLYNSQFIGNNLNQNSE